MESIRPHHRLTAAILALLMLFSFAPTTLATSSDGAMEEEGIILTEGLPETGETSSSGLDSSQGTEPVFEPAPAPETEPAEPEAATAPETEPEAAPIPEAEPTNPEATPTPEVEPTGSAAALSPTPVPEAAPTPSPTPALVEEQIVRYAPGALLDDPKDFVAEAYRTKDGKLVASDVIAQGDVLTVQVNLAADVESFGGYLLQLEYDKSLFAYKNHRLGDAIEEYMSMARTDFYSSDASSGRVMPEGTLAVRVACISATPTVGAGLQWQKVPLKAGETALSVDFLVKSDAMLESAAFNVVILEVVDQDALELGAYYGEGVPASVQIVPGAPEMTFTSSGKHYMGELSWALQPGLTSEEEGHFKLERETNGSGEWAILSDGFFGSSYTDSRMLPGDTYRYRLTAYAKNGDASYLQSFADGSTAPNAEIDDDFGATAKSSTRIDLTWTHGEAAHVKGYIVERDAGSGGFVELKKVEASKATDYSYADSTAYRGVTFSYRVTPYTLNSKGDEIRHKSRIVKAEIPYPDAPVVRAEKGSAPGEVKLEWDPLGGSHAPYTVGYYIYRTENGGSWQQIGKTGDTGYIDSNGIKPEVEYRYRLQAYMELDGTLFLGRLEGAGTPYTYSLHAPTDLKHTVQATNSVNLTWTEPEYADGYLLYRAAKGEAHGAMPLAVLPADKTSYTDDTLTQGAAYEYFLYSYTEKDGARYVAPTQEPETLAVTIPYASVVQITSAASDNPYKADITWNRVKEDDGANTAYTVYRIAEEAYKANAAANTEKTLWDAVLSGGSIDSFTDSSASLKPGKRFIYRVQATVTADGTALPGRFGGGATVQIAAPKAPTGVKTQINGDLNNAPSIRISWDYGSDPVDGFAVFRSDNNNTRLQVASIEYDESIHAGGLSESAQDNTVLSDIPYSYTVQAYCMVDGERVWSAESEAATVTILQPGKPAGIQTTATSDGIDIAWSAVDGVDGYFLYRLDGGTQDWDVANLKGKLAERSFSDSDGILRGESYTYGVIAYKTVGSSGDNFLVSEMAVSEPVQALSAEKPAELAVSLVSDGYVRLVWKAPADIQPAWYGVYREGYLSDGVSKYQTEAKRQLASIPATAEKDSGFSYRDVSSKKGWSYTYTVVSYDTSGSRILNGGSASDSVTLPTLSFAKDWTLTAAASDGMASVGSNAILISWEKDADVWPDGHDLEGYTVYRKLSGKADSTYVPLGDVEVEEASLPYTFIDSTGVANTSYVYALKAYTRDSDSKYYGVNYSPASKAVKPIALSAASAEITSAAVLKDKTIRIEWEAVPGAANYAVWRAPIKPSGAQEYNASFTRLTTTPGLFYEDKNAARNTEYGYFVQALRAGQTPSLKGLSLSIKRDILIPDYTAPAFVSAETAMVSDGKVHAITVSWEHPEDGKTADNLYKPADGYELYYLNGTKLGKAVPGGDISSDGSGSYSFTDSNGGLGLKPSTRYSYTVRPYWLAANRETRIYGSKYETRSINSNAAITEEALAPANLKAETVNATSIRITWDKMEGVSGYALYRSDGKTGTRTAVKTNLGAAVTSFTDTKRSAGVEYVYSLQAYVGSAATNPGAKAYVAHTIPKIGSCGELKARSSDANSVVLQWSAPTEGTDDIAGYGVYRVTGRVADGKLNNKAFTWKLVDTVASDALVYSDASLLPNTTYSFMVRPYAQGSDKTEIWGADSNTVVESTTNLHAPEGLTASANTATSVKLSWEAFDEQYSGVVTGYSIYRATSDGKANPNSFTKLGTVAATARATSYSYIDTKAKQGVDYRYQVAAYYSKTEGKRSNDAWAKVVQLPKVENPKAVPSSGAHGVGMELSWDYDWDKNGGLLPAGAAHGIHVFAKGGKAVLAEIPSGSDGRFYHGGLIPNTSYSYDIKPYYIGSGGTPIYGLVTTTVATATKKDIPAPRNLRLEVLLNGTQVRLGWDAPEGVAGLSGYKVYRSDGKAEKLLATVNANTFSYTDKTADPQVPYTYYVKAYRSTLLGFAGNEQSYTVPAPAQPLLKGEAEVLGAQAIRVRWEPGVLDSDGNPADGANAYRVLRRQRSLGADGTYGAWSAYSVINSKVAAVEGQLVYEYKDSAKKTAGTLEYAYTVEAYNTVNKKTTYSGYNMDGLRATLPTLKKAPVISYTSVDGPVVTITWEPVENADGYEIVRGVKLSDGVFPSDGNGKLSYTDNAAVGRTKYTYQVRAYIETEGERIYSAYSNKLTFTTGYAFADSVTIQGNQYVATGKSLTLTATLAPSGKTNNKVNWTLEGVDDTDTLGATIIPDAKTSTKATLQAGQSTGKVRVVATAADDSGNPASCGFVVEIGTGRISIDPKGTAELSGGQSRTLGVIYEGTNSTNAGKLTWSLVGNGSQYAAISGSKLTAKAKTLTEPVEVQVQLSAANLKDQAPASCAFMLYPEAAKIGIYPSDGSVDHYAMTGEKVQTIGFDMAAGSTLQLIAAVSGPKGTEEGVLQNVTWSTSSKAIAAVDAETGLVSVQKPGTVTITAKANSNNKISASFKLQVYYMDAVSKLSAKLFTASDAKTLLPAYGLQMGDTAYIAVYGADKEKALDPSLFSYEITNKAQQAFVQVLDEPGMVRALANTKAGSATVKVSLKNDPNKRSVNVAVKTALVQVGKIGFASSGSFVEGLANDGYTMQSGVLNVDSAAKNYVFTVRPTITDTDGREISPALTYASTNTGVASVKANADGSAIITVKAKASGSVRITATAKDAAKAQGFFDMNVCDYTPRLEATKFTINSALGKAVVTTQLRESFGNAIRANNGELTLHAYNSVTKRYELPVDNFKAQYADGKLSLLYTGDTASVKAQNLQLTVPTDREVYTFILNVTVKSTLPKVTVKQNAAFNLFYQDSQAEFVFATAETIEKVELADTEHFRILGSGGAVTAIVFAEDLTDAVCQKPDTSATFRVFLKGYETPVPVKATIRTAKTAPVLLVSPASVTLNTKLAQRGSSFTLYEKMNPGEVFDLEDQSVSYTASASTLEVDYDSDVLTLNLTGNAANTATIYVQQENWTAPVKLTHRINVTTANPSITYSPASLSLNTQFGKTQASTIATLNQGGQSFKEISATLVENAKKTSVKDGKTVLSFDEVKAAITITSDPVTGKITAAYNNGGKALTGSAVFLVEFTVDGFAPLKKELTVKLENSLPTVKLGTGTLRFNQRFLGEHETAESLLTLNKTGYTVMGVSVADGGDGYANKYPNNSGLVRFTVSRNRDGAPVLKAQLDPGIDTPVKGKYTYTLNITLQNDATGTTNTVTVKPVVEIYDNAKYSATVKQSGSLDAVLQRYASSSRSTDRLDNTILYTLTKLTNVSGAVDDVHLVGVDADKFVLNSLLFKDPSPKPASGLGFVQLGLKEGESYATNRKYSVQLAFSVEGMQTLVYSPVLSISVKQSTAKYTLDPATQTFYQGETQPERSYTLTRSTPAGAYLERLSLNTTATPAALLQALGVENAADFQDNIDIHNDPAASYASITVKLKNPGALVAGRSYNLVLDAYAQGHAENLKPVQVKLAVKVMK